MCYNFDATVNRFFAISYLPIKAIEFLTAFLGCAFKDLPFDTKIINETLGLARDRTARGGVLYFWRTLYLPSIDIPLPTYYCTRS